MAPLWLLLVVALVGPGPLLEFVYAATLVAAFAQRVGVYGPTLVAFGGGPGGPRPPLGICICSNSGGSLCSKSGAIDPHSLSKGCHQSCCIYKFLEGAWPTRATTKSNQS